MNIKKHPLEYIISLFLALYAAGFVSPAPLLGQQSPQTPAGYPDLYLYESQRAKNTCETLEKRRNYLLETTPIDSLIADYARRGFDVVCDTVSLLSLFEQASIQDREELRTRYDELYETARMYNSNALLRMMDFIKVWLIGQVRELDDERNKACEDLVHRCRRTGDDKLAVYALMYMWKSNYFGQNYARSFADARRLEQALDGIGDDFPFKIGGYIRMGTACYHFKDYDHAVALFHKGLALRGGCDLTFSINRVLLAWNSLGVYHEIQGDLDSAAYYHRTILSSPEAVVNEPVNLDIAICNLGRIEMARGDYDAGIAYLKAGLEHLEQNPPGINWDFPHGVYISLGECMLAKDDLPAAAQYIAKVRPGLEAFPPHTQANRLKDLFALESRYYSRLGEFGKADTCLDSAKFYTERYERLTSENVITLGEQQLHEAEIELNRQQIARQRNIISGALAVLAFICMALFVIVRLYRKKWAAYRDLVEKNRLWASSELLEKVTATPLPEPSAPDKDSPGENNGISEDNRKQPTQREVELTERIHRMMIGQQLYRDKALSMDTLARMLNVTREAVSRAINRTTGKNFFRFLNEYRIKEAIQILLASRNQKVNFDDLAEQVGFNNRTTFHRAFKQITGLPPNEFKNKA